MSPLDICILLIIISFVVTVYCDIESLEFQFYDDHSKGIQHSLPINVGDSVEYEVHKYCVNYNCTESTFKYILQFVRDTVIKGAMDDRVNFGYPLAHEDRNYRNENVKVGAFINHPACVQYNIPSVHCSDLQVIGQGEGSYAVCNDFIHQETPCELIYSFGVYTDLSFEIEIGSIYNCKNVFAFDPSSISLLFVEEHRNTFPSFLHFRPYGISDENDSNGVIETGTQKEVDVELYDLPTILSKLNHTNQDIFLLKMDIEGQEIMVLNSLITKFPSIFNRIHNLCMEVHWEANYTGLRLDHFTVFFDDILLNLVEVSGFKLYHSSPRYNASRQTICLTRDWSY